MLTAPADTRGAKDETDKTTLRPNRGPYSARPVPVDEITVDFISRRIMPYIVRTPGCHVWIRGTNGKGYGRLRIGDQTYTTHRVIYALTHGNPPPGTVLDHTCGVTRCVNPDHLDVVSQWQNVQRGALERDEAGRFANGEDI